MTIIQEREYTDVYDGERQIGEIDVNITGESVHKSHSGAIHEITNRLDRVVERELQAIQHEIDTGEFDE